MDVSLLSQLIPVLCHSDRLIHGESCPHLDVVHPWVLVLVLETQVLVFVLVLE